MKDARIGTIILGDLRQNFESLIQFFLRGFIVKARLFQPLAFREDILQAG